ncbi:MAG: phosphoglucosamine mutase, partial [Pyrinomonadaceae bacterium]|nr:phosphoglucosamine mutase [Pyrinomonadaceae bacterium]
MKKLFGTDGMRGAAGIFPLDAETVKIVGASLASQIKQKNQKTPKFVIGRDTRESGSWLETAFCEGATSQGAECISAEIITTPAVAFLTKDLQADAGIVVSASHNPFEDNGIKIFTDSGRKLDEATESRIEKDIHETKFDFQSSNGVSKSEFSFVELQNIYLDYLAKEFENLRLDDLKIVVDCANGAASNLAPRLFERLGAKVTAIYDKPNGRNINDDCGSLHLNKLQSKVLTENAGFGVAFDGDADRALFVDGNGNLVDGDATLWAMAC